MSHPLFSVIAAILLSAAMAATEDRTPRRRLDAGLRTLAQCAAAIAGGGWLMYLIHG